jgi:hypothetical protein
MTLSAHASLADETGFAQNVQMLRYRWSCHLKLRRDRVHGLFAIAQKIEDAPARRVGECREYVDVHPLRRYALLLSSLRPRDHGGSMLR